MNRTNASLSAFALAMAMLPTSSAGEPPQPNASQRAPSAQKKIAFHVIGLMKTKSGAT